MAIKVQGSTIIDDSRNVVSAGIVTATSFVGDVTGTATTATNLADGANITTGTIAAARLGSGVDAAKFLRGDNTWQTVSSGGLGSVEDDTSPKLGGDLDINSKNITGTGSIDITGNLDVSGVSTLGTVASGIWSGTAIADAYVASAATWNAKQNALTFGIANTNAVKIDDQGVADDEYARFTANGIEGRSAADVKTDLSLTKSDVGLGNVENTALSTWTGNTSITSLGVVGVGTWQGTAIAYSALSGVTTHIIGDTSPQLGGNLDINSKDITGTGNIDITGSLDVSGITTLGKAANGAVELYYDNSLKFITVGTGVSISNGVGNTATIFGPSNIIIDPHPIGVGATSGNVRIKGDLYVDGTQFIVNSETITLGDFVVGIGTTVTTDALTDGAGIGIGSIGYEKTFLYEYNSGTNPSLKSSENLNVASGKAYQIAETSVLNATTLGSGVVNSSLTGIGTITSGTWQGTKIAAGYLADTAVTAGSYTNASITVDAQGRLTSASTGSSGVTTEFVSAQTLNIVGLSTFNGHVAVGNTAVFQAAHNSAPVVRITQEGNGDALLVQDQQGGDDTPFVIKSDGKVGIGTTNPITPLQINQVYGLATGIGTYNASAGVTTDIDSFSISSFDFKTVEYTLHFENASNIQSQKVLVMKNATTAYSQEYSIMYHPERIVSIGATVDGGNLKIQSTAETGISGLTTYRFVRGSLL